jgi:ribonuclease HII
MKTLGLDEAGRGCVLGPLVVGGFLWEQEDDQPLREAGADDSKKLSAKKREKVRGNLISMGNHYIREITPESIDAENINTLEEEAFASIIVESKPDHVIIDAPCHPAGIPNFQKRLSLRLVQAGCAIPTFTIQPKADATFAACGSASIFAKVHRDAHIKTLGEVGSGYPSDPKTRNWLLGFIQRDEPFPDCVRKRWGTIESLRQQNLF